MEVISENLVDARINSLKSHTIDISGVREVSLCLKQSISDLKSEWFGDDVTAFLESIDINSIENEISQLESLVSNLNNPDVFKGTTFHLDMNKPI